MLDPSSASGPSSKPATPHPIDALRVEHGIVLSVLEQMERECARLTEHRRWNLEFWTSTLTFYDSFHDRCHHVKEEQLLFPLLEAAGLPPDGPTATLRTEHDRGRVWRLRIGEALNANDQTRMLASVAGFLDFQRQHIRKEDQLVFPLAMRILSPAATLQLARAFAQAEDELPPLPVLD